MKPIFPYVPAHTQLKERRLFIANALKASLASVVTFSLSDTHAASFFVLKKSYTVGEIIDIIIKDIPGAPFAQTVDTLKSGNREMVVTGVVTTMFATVDIIQQAIKAGANFIIAHEPTFYNHTDDKTKYSPNHIGKKKEELLAQNKIAVWRCHDYLHSFVPDSVEYQVVKDLGWLSSFKAGSPILSIPQISLADLAQHLKTKLKIERVRIIGNLSQKCEKIALLPGAAGAQSHIGIVEKEKPDVLIVGEVQEWETAEYIRDTQLFGEKTSLIILGHSVSEEPGLQWLKEWLQPKLEGIHVTHITSGSPFSWV